MKAFLIILSALVGGVIGGSVAQTVAASLNQIGLFPAATLTNGQCLQVQASGVTNGIVGVPCPTSQPPLTIGTTTVAGATTSSCLIIDANGKLAQASCLTAN